MISHDQRRVFGGHINVKDESHRLQLNGFALFEEEKLIVNGHVTLQDPRKEGVGGREKSSRQFRVRTSSGILSLANVLQAEDKTLLTRKGVGEK